VNWLNLLSSQKSGSTGSQQNFTLDETRNPFERDFDRIVFSSAFRRLQDKTQVVPLPESDFVHTRLTHSLETSCVGRSLGKMAGKIIIERNSDLRNDGVTSSVFGSIVAAACLAHDIGNPPFGHSGEKAISDFFIDGPGSKLRERITVDKQWHDLTAFEGNANGFRILTNSLNNPNGGLRLTFGTLAAFSKYPKESLPVGLKGASSKKFGFFQSEKALFQEVAESVGLLERSKDDLVWHRHPLAFLVEAADDICYSIIDFEDGLRLGLIPANHALELLQPVAGKFFRKESFDKINTFNEQVGYLRAIAIGALTEELVQVFAEHEQDILNGSFDVSLIKHSKSLPYIEEIKKLSLDHLYRSRTVLEIEAAGFEVLGGLLEIFLETLNRHAEGRMNFRIEKMLSLLPKQLVEVSFNAQDDYTRCMLVCEYVAGMTDTYALSLYRKLKGIELPG
jgi:dGTPase